MSFLSNLQSEFSKLEKYYYSFSHHKNFSNRQGPWEPTSLDEYFTAIFFYVLTTGNGVALMKNMYTYVILFAHKSSQKLRTSCQSFTI